MEKCAECREYLEEMESKLASRKYTEINKAQAKVEIRAYEAYFSVGVSTLSSDVEVTYENVDGLVRIGFVPKKDNIYIGGGFGVSDPAVDGAKEKLLLINYHVNPLKKMDYQANMVNRMQQQALYLNYAFIDEDTVLCVNQYDEIVRVKGDEKLAVEYGDRTKIITINNLRTEEGIKKLR